MCTPVAATLSGRDPPEECRSFEFPSQADARNHQSYVERSLARVHAVGAGDTAVHKGAAIVISLRPFLLVTASHVVPDAAARVSFPSMDPSTPYEAAVIARSNEGPIARAHEEIRSSLTGHDFAVLLVSEPPSHGVGTVDLWLDMPDRTTNHAFFGFTRDSTDPVVGGGQLARHEACSWLLRDTSTPGDSGGAVVGNNGLLVGLAVRGLESGGGPAFGLLNVLPLACVRTELRAAFARQASTLPYGLTHDAQVLDSKLRPPPVDGYVDNIHLDYFVEMLLEDKIRLEDAKSRGIINCPIAKAVNDRKLGWNRALEIVNAAASLPLEAAALYTELGNMMFASGDLLLAQEAFVAASTQLNTYFAEGRTTSVDEPFQVDFDTVWTQTIVGLSQGLAELGESAAKSNHKWESVEIAARGVSYATEAEAQGQLLNNLGEIAFKAGDWRVALEAFNDAAATGFNPTAARSKSELICEWPYFDRSSYRQCSNQEYFGFFESLNESRLRGIADDAATLATNSPPNELFGDPSGPYGPLPQNSPPIRWRW